MMYFVFHDVSQHYTHLAAKIFYHVSIPFKKDTPQSLATLRGSRFVSYHPL